jgi:hypothetical protein
MVLVHMGTFHGLSTYSSRGFLPIPRPLPTWCKGWVWGWRANALVAVNRTLNVEDAMRLAIRMAPFPLHGVGLKLKTPVWMLNMLRHVGIQDHEPDFRYVGPREVRIDINTRGYRKFEVTEW